MTAANLSAADADVVSGLLIPVDGPVVEIDLTSADNLEALQAAVGGWIEPIVVPSFIPGADRSTVYVNEEGKILGLEPNMRATDFLVPGFGIAFGDVIRGPMVVTGFDPVTGDTAELPGAVRRRVRKIEQEAGS